MIERLRNSDNWWSASELAAAKSSVHRIPHSAGDSAPSEHSAPFDSSIVESFEGLFRKLSLSESQIGEPQTNRDIDPTLFAESLLGLRIGRFVIKDCLGYGGFGVVFRAYDGELDRDIALKVPRPERFQQPELNRRVLEEARAAAKLRHPGIVQVHEVGSIGPIVYIASELCEGKTLHAWLSWNEKPLPARVAAKFVMDLADAIGFAHTRGIIHQDLKPANVLVELGANAPGLSAESTLRVTDFGLACRVSNGGDVNSSMLGGTRRYMAPEQRDGDASQIGTHTDVYALGVLLGEMLLGDAYINERAIDPTNASDSPIVRPVSVQQGRRIPRDLWAIHLKCVETEPSHRYSHAGALQMDLRRYLNCEPVTARPIGMAERSSLWFQRRPLVASLVATIAVGTLIAFSMIFREWRRAEANYEIAFEQSRLAEQRLHDAESLLVRMSWALDESFFFNDSGYTFDTDFRQELTRDLATLALHRKDSLSVSLPGIAAALRRQGYDAYERNDFVAGERLTKQSVDTWLRVLRNETNNRIYRRSAALTVYYLTIYGFSAGKDAEQLLTLENRELIPDFSWENQSDVRLAEDLARLLQARALAIEKLPNLPGARATHFASRNLWQQLSEHWPARDEYRLEYAREHGAMGQCDYADGNFRRARMELLQAATLLQPLVERQEVASVSRELYVRLHEAAAECLMRLEQWPEALRSFELALLELNKSTEVTPEKLSRWRADIEAKTVHVRTCIATLDAK